MLQLHNSPFVNAAMQQTHGATLRKGMNLLHFVRRGLTDLRFAQNLPRVARIAGKM
jgi:hypothetical protein